MSKKIKHSEVDIFHSWQNDWNKFARDCFDVRLDRKQQEILEAVQKFNKVSVVSGAARGKDYVSAVAALCFLYLTPRFNNDGEMTHNTKVALTAATGGQIQSIMMPEISRLFVKGKRYDLPGILLNYQIKMPFREWFLIGFKSDDYNLEAWTGFHATNVMYVVTEASGISEKIWGAIEGNLQGNSKLLIVFNPNRAKGYAARTCFSEQWKHFKLNSLDSPNVLAKKIVVPGQVDYVWVKDKVETQCEAIPNEKDVKPEKSDFKWEGKWYRPNDWFRIKVLGEFPEEPQSILVPRKWIELANDRWRKWKLNGHEMKENMKLGVDVAGMGTDETVFCPRHGDIVDEFEGYNSGGVANHMETAGRIKHKIKINPKSSAYIDTIGEGAGVFSRCIEQKVNAFSVKSTESTKKLRDYTGIYEFSNMRNYLYWAIRDWLNPAFESEAMLPPNKKLAEELSEIIWSFDSAGRPVIEDKDSIKERLRRSPDYSESLSLTFYPYKTTKGKKLDANQLARMV